MDLTGRITDILEEVTGQGKNGMWKKRGFVVETSDKYPKKIHFNAWGDLADNVNAMTKGTNLKVYFELDSREYNGRWYTEAKAWKLESQGVGAAAPSSSSTPIDLAPISEDEMPF